MQNLSKMELEKRIDEIANFDIDEFNVFGSSYVVNQNGKTILKKHYGVTSENGYPVSDKTLFRLASMSKPITALATLLLVDKNLISLEDKLNSYIPQFKDSRVKIKHLLSHTSGIDDTNDVNLMTAEDKASVNNTINFFADKKLAFSPGKKDLYSAFAAFDYLVAVIEKVTKEDYFYYLSKHILQPLNMRNTGFIPTKEQWNDFIQVNGKSENGCKKCDMNDGCIFNDFPCNHYLGGAGMFGCLSDYLSFAELLLNDGVTNSGERIISAKTLKAMLTNQLSTTSFELDKEETWGLGVRIVTSDNHATLPKGAYGWSGAYGSHFWIDPKNKISAVYMKNSAVDGGASNASAVRFEKAVYQSLH